MNVFNWNIICMQWSAQIFVSDIWQIYNHHWNQDLKHSITLENGLKSLPSPPTHRQPLFLSPQVSFSYSWTSGESSCALHRKGSCVCLLPLHAALLRFLCMAGESSAPLCWVALHCMTVSQFASCSRGCTLFVSTWGLVWMKLLWTALCMSFRGHRLSFSSAEYLWVANNTMLNIISH